MPVEKSRSMPILRRVLLTVGVVISVLVIGLIGMSFLPDSIWKHWIGGILSEKTGREVRIEGPVKVHMLSLTPSLAIDGLEIPNAPWAGPEPMVRIRHFEASLRLASLLHFNLVLPRVRIDAPEIDLQRDKDNRANWDFTAAGKPAKPAPAAPLRLPAIQELVLTDGRLIANDAIRKIRFSGQMSVAERIKNAGDSALNIRGKGTLNGKPFELKISGGALQQVDAGEPYEFDAAVTAADIKLDAHTKIHHAFDLGAFDSAFHLRGKDLADAYYLTALALPNTPPYELSGTLRRDELQFAVNDFKGRVGKSDVEGTVSVDARKARPVFKADLKSKLFSLTDLAAPLGTQASAANKSDTLAPAQPTPVNPRSGANGRARQAVAKADVQATETGYLLPDADLQVQRVRDMDADVNFEALAIQAEKMPMKKVRIHLLLKDGQLQVKPLEFTLPQGQFTGDVTIDARPSVPVTDLDMRITHVDLAQFKPKNGDAAPLAGEMTGRIQLHGSGASVHKAASAASGDLTFVLPHGEMREALAELTGINVAKGLGLLLTKNAVVSSAFMRRTVI
jgi:uncharacterized protein involved in outer membrane biogenesis